MRILPPLLLGAAMLLLSGCTALVMGANVGAQALVGHTTNSAKAKRCFELDQRMDKQKATPAERQREKTLAYC